jgi:predicted Ser/Thr protein kinase
MLRDFVDGRYRVEQEVGRGGMGIVLRAFDTRLNRAVAIKILPPDATHDPDRLRRLAAEARAASALNHTGIATVYDFVEQGADSFIVYEYIDGRTLRNSLTRDRFSTDDVLGVGIQLADALVAAHTRGITHRDLKPENIMLVPDDHFRWRVKILDFGLAKQRPELLSAGTESGAETVSVATVPGLLVGTITYMAPEQLESRTTDERTDIYALGLVLYEMATGANPFMGRTLPSTIANILKQEPQTLGQKDPAAPAELDRILRKCLRKNPNERYQSTRELLVDLRDFRRDFALSPVTQVPASAPSPLRRFFLLFGATPQHRWEVMHLRMFLWCMLLAYLGWRFAASARDRSGFILFLVQLACILFITILLSFLLYTLALDPSALPHEVQRLAPWIRGLTLALVLVTWAMCAVAVGSQPVLATLLALCSTAGGLKYTVFKTAIDRGIFPKQ